LLVWSTKHEKTIVASSSTQLPSSSKELARNLTKSILGQENGAIQPTENKIIPQSLPAEYTNYALVDQSFERGQRNVTDSLTAIREQLNRSTVPEFLLHLPTMLVEYYFSYVCQIFSSFDGTMNPFRSTVGRLWDGSAPIYYAIQSMAAAYLSHHFPRMAPVGVQMQREAFKSLYQVSQTGRDPGENLDKTLLTVLLVGQTTAWHNPKDLGLAHLKTAKLLNQRRLDQQGTISDSRARRQNEFFEQCILYWDMLAGYVEDDIDEFGFGEFDLGDARASSSPESDLFPSSNEDTEKVFPHPWTGVSPRIQKLFAQVGRLVRGYRKGIAQEASSSMDFLNLDLGLDMEFPDNSTVTIEAVAKAHSLEEDLLSFEPPSACNLVDAGDENTPVQQYLILAEAFRCAALLEIYRIFPAILFKRVPFTATDFTTTIDTAHQLSTILPFPTSQGPNDFIVSLAIHTLALLEKIPSTSGTRCLQPIVIIAAASELRFAAPSTSLSDPFSPSTIFNSLTGREVDIASARRFATTRLQEYQLSLPAKPIVKALQLVQETWDRADLGQDVFWMDVMDEMGWKTIFG
jgi:hypothetical protein